MVAIPIIYLLSHENRERNCSTLHRLFVYNGCFWCFRVWKQDKTLLTCFQKSMRTCWETLDHNGRGMKRCLTCFCIRLDRHVVWLLWRRFRPFYGQHRRYLYEQRRGFQSISPAITIATIQKLLYYDSESMYLLGCRSKRLAIVIIEMFQ